MKHTAFVEFEVKTGESVLTAEEQAEYARYLPAGAEVPTTLTHWYKERTICAEDEVDAHIKLYTDDPDTFLSELSCAAGCPACESGQASPFV